MNEVTEQQREDMEALFVQTAASMTSDQGTITLRGLSPSTLYFADRPQREVGPTATGACALFIDPFGRPLSPVSAAGIHRRERRRR
ncbi:MAG TPA: hypothetical protein VG253_05260 [Streptosporangiaceae bacterium]|nr:hypothetical protein [Streptosporangiaceae bacterium]